MKRYIITDSEKLNGVLDLYTELWQAKTDLEFYHEGGKRGETNLIKIEYDGRIYDYDRYDYKINFFEKRENNKGYATPYLDRNCLENRNIKITPILTLNQL